MNWPFERLLQRRLLYQSPHYSAISQRTVLSDLKSRPTAALLKNNRVFVGCHNQTLVVFDLFANRVVFNEKMPLGSGAIPTPVKFILAFRSVLIVASANHVVVLDFFGLEIRKQFHCSHSITQVKLDDAEENVVVTTAEKHTLIDVASLVLSSQANTGKQFANYKVGYHTRLVHSPQGLGLLDTFANTPHISYFSKHQPITSIHVDALQTQCAVVYQDLLEVYDLATMATLVSSRFNSNSYSNCVQMDELLIVGTKCPHKRGDTAGILTIDVVSHDEQWVNLPFTSATAGLLSVDGRQLLVCGDQQVTLLSFEFSSFPHKDQLPLREGSSTTRVSRGTRLAKDWINGVQLQREEKPCVFRSSGVIHEVTDRKCANLINWMHQSTPMNQYMMRMSQLGFQQSQQWTQDPPLFEQAASLVFDQSQQ